MNPIKNARTGMDPLTADVLFLAGYVLTCVGMFALLRGILLYTNFDLAVGIPVSDLSRSFLVGARFDLMIVCILAVPLVPGLLLPGGLGRRKVALFWLLSTGVIVLFSGVVEPEFYREFHTRLNSIAFHYLQEDATTVTSMIWNGFPVVRYLLLWFALCGLFIIVLLRINRLTKKRQQGRYRPVVRMTVFLLVLFFTFWGGRGTLRTGPPLRWGDAFHSQYVFANHLALNGVFTLAKAALASPGDGQAKRWLTAMPAATATQITREMLLTPADTLLDPDQYPLLRRHQPDVRMAHPPKNFVLIIMESFSGEFTGALGNDHAITPEFDKLAAQGLLFDHFFSNGTHTHQGMFASVACFPNLPGHEYLMQQPQGQHRFSGLPAILKPAGFNDVYVYNGDFSWDNQLGFFRNQGMSHFVGRDEYKNPVFEDPTWGVSDEDMFNRSLVELDKLGKQKPPFFAVLQSLSNHTPYALPDNLPVEKVTGFGALNKHLTAMRYSDWAIGRFFAEAVKKPWYKDTLFAIIGDHGFPISPQLSEIDLLRFHIPLLLLAPGIQDTYGAHNHTTGTQVDIVPTAVSLLGKPFVHQCWGRDLLALPAGDPGVGLIKPSGSDQTVALLTGKLAAVKPPNEAAVTGHYSLSEKSFSRLPDDPAISSKMAKELSAFVETGLQALKDNRVGRGDR